MILVVGGTGFIGYNLVQELSANQDTELIVLSTKAQKNKNFKTVHADITKKEDLSQIKEDIEIIYHMAAYIPPSNKPEDFQKCLEINSKGTYNLLKFAMDKNVKKFVYSSTVSVYKNPPLYLPIDENHLVYPSTYYGMSKLIGETLCSKFSNEFNLDTISLRYSSVYGMGQKPNSVLPIFLSNVLKNNPPLVYGDGTYSQDFVYIKDVVKANILAGTSKKSGVYNIASGLETNMIELVNKIIEIASKDVIPIFDKSKTEISTKNYYDISKAKNDLNYYPDFNLHKGLTDYMNKLKVE